MPTTAAAPKTAWAWARSEGQSRCRGRECGRMVTWVQMVKTGSRMCFDRLTVLDRKPQTNASSGQQDEAIQLDLADNHWATCPNRGQFSSKTRDTR